MPQPTWSDVRNLLDNPQVPVQDKRSMLLRSGSDQIQIDDQDRYPQELEDYEKKYGVPDNGSDPSGTEFQDAYDHASKAAGDAAQYDGAVRKGLDTLTNIQKNADSAGGAGTGNSNDILNQGDPALAFFDRFSPVYQAVGGRFRKMLGGDTSAKFVRGRYDEQRDINFGHFAAEADSLKKAAGTQQSQTRDMADKLGGLWHGWTGPTANAAQHSFTGLHQRASRVGDALTGAAQVSTDATHNVSKIVSEKATNVLHSIPDRNTIAGMTPDRARDIVDVANGDQDDDKIKRACSYFNVDTSGCGDGYKQQVMSKAGDWVSQVFCPHFETTFNSVIKICDDAKKAVDDAWKVLTDHLAQIPENPFPDAHSGQQHSGGAPGGSGGGTTAGGGGGTVGGGMPSGGSPATPGSAGADPSQLASSIPAQPGSPETVTLGTGHDSVTVQQPDRHGHTKVTLTGADGQPKTYDVAVGGHPGTAMPGGASGQAPAPSMPAAPNPDGSIPVQPGADGHAVIHDGARTITMERNPDGRLQVSVDNGGGRPPVSQTVGFGAADPGGTPLAPPQAGSEPPLQAQPPQGAPLPTAPEYQPLATASADAGAGVGAPGAADGAAPTSSQAAGFSTTGGLAAAAPGSFGGASGQIQQDGAAGSGGPGQPDAAMAPGAHAGAVGLGSMQGVDAGSQEGAAGLQSMGDPAAGAHPGAAQPAQAQSQGGTTMMGPMGGMGGMGAMGARGGGKQRSNASPWRTQGRLFDDGVETSDVRFKSVLGAAEEEDK